MGGLFTLLFAFARVAVDEGKVGFAHAPGFEEGREAGGGGFGLPKQPDAAGVLVQAVHEALEGGWLSRSKDGWVGGWVGG